MSLTPSQQKLVSTSVIIAVIIASMGCVIVYDETRSDDQGSNSVYNILARVNSEGSGIYMNNDIYEDHVDKDGNPVSDSIPERNGVNFYKVNADGTKYVDADCKAAWGGLICGTPGNTSIQHVQMKEMVEKMGLSFILYETGSSPSSSSVYYINTIVNYDKAMNSESNNGVQLDIGILWEPQFSYIVDVPSTETFKSLGLTNDFFPGHTCCVLGGYTSYISSHSEATERFLAAYVKTVQWVQNANNPMTAEMDPLNPGKTVYETLVSTCAQSTGLVENVIKDALSSIAYTYGDDDGNGSTDLHLLKKDISGIVTSNSSNLKYSMEDLGFQNSIQFANRFVDESYLMNAIALDGSSLTGSYRITVAAISGDIHQIALQVGLARGIFAEYGVNVGVAYQSNGAGVAVALQNGSAQFGFLGAPPATITAVNGQLITV